MFYYLYEIKNLINNKIYVGVHKTNDLNDGYMGSGKIIRSAIQKHGISNFSKVILEQFDNSTSMYAREKEVVTDEFLARKDVYNLRRGGFGGFDHINSAGLNYKGFSSAKDRNNVLGLPSIAGNAFANRMLEDLIFRKEECNKRKVRMLTGKSLFNLKENQEKGNLAARSSESVEKRKEKFKKINHQQGEKNSQFGKMWITNEQESLTIKKTDPVPEGWRKGRIIK